jgi:hypothetical protein
MSARSLESKVGVSTAQEGGTREYRSKWTGQTAVLEGGKSSQVDQSMQWCVIKDCPLIFDYQTGRGNSNRGSP